MTKEDITGLWSEYERAESVHTRLGIDTDTERAYRFYEGDQWYGLESGDEELPVYNFIAPLIRYKTAMIAMNELSINFSTPTADTRLEHAMAGISRLASKMWERHGMSSKCWDAVKSSLIGGDSYIYVYDSDGACQVIDRTDIYFENETESDISAQRYILIKERKNVADIRKAALENGVAKSIADNIIADGDPDNPELCTGVLKMWLVDSDLYFVRFTKQAVYQPTQVIKGLGCYPIAALVCNKKRGSCRGLGEVVPIIPNQIEINKNLARRLINAKLTAYSRLVYSSERIVNPKTLTEVGTAIEVEGGSVGSIKEAVDYLTPSSMSPDAKTLSDELLGVTKELSGAGDAVLGSIDPAKASGAAIIAVRDQAAIPLNEQTARFRQFTEDIARIWYNILAVYNPTELEYEGGSISGREMSLIAPDVRVDISSATPFSKYARDSALEKLFTMGHITFDEYVGALDDDSSVPRAKLEHILKLRGGTKNVTEQNK